MIYGKNFLPTIPGRWTLANSTMTDSKMTINAGGWTATFIEQEDISLLPESMRLTIIASEYTDAYNPSNFVDISIITETEEYIEITCPIVNTGNGVYTADIELRESEYTQFRVAIRSMLGMEVTSWRLSAPIGGDNTAIIEELRGELPRLLYDYNTTPLTVDHKEQTIALISAWLVKDTDLNGHVQFTYTATHNTRLHIRCKGNDISELFTPVIYDITPGRGSIGIPHAYLQKKVGYHTFTVSAQVEEGTITFATRAIIYTIDGGHLASRVQDVGINVSDIAIRRLEEDREPSHIYAIGIDEGEISVRSRVYSEIAAVAWEPRLQLGVGIDASIEFDGQFQIQDTYYRFITEEEPYLFWVDEENNLWGRAWDDEGTKLLLSPDVLKVSTVRGWKSINTVLTDQGLICAYIKTDGTVWYRNYCEQIDLTYQWDNEEEVTELTTPIVDLNLFRTNDYRVGFSAVDANGKVITLLTERTWSGMANPPEKIRVGIQDVTLEVIPIAYHDTYSDDEHIETGIIDVWFNVAEPIYPKVLSISNDDEYTIRIKFSHTIDYDLSTVGQAFSIKDSSNTSFDIVSTSAGVDNSELILTLVNFNGAFGNMLVTYDRTVVELDCLNQGSRFGINSFTYEFTPDLMPPEGFGEEHIEVGITDVTLNVQQVYYSNAYNGGENLEASITDISFVVTKVGEKPL